MKMDNSNKRYSIFIAGILVIIGFSIFVGLLIGFGDNNIFKKDGFQLAYINPPISEKTSLNQDARGNENVPVAKSDWYGPFETVRGTISYKIYVDGSDGSNADGVFDESEVMFTDGVCNDPNFRMPLCLQDTVDMDAYLVGLDVEDRDPDFELAGWLIKAEMTGGYSLLQSYLKVVLVKDGSIDWSSLEYLYIDWDDGVKQATGCSTVFTGIFDVDDNLDVDTDESGAVDSDSVDTDGDGIYDVRGADDGSGMILLDSSHSPAPEEKDLNKRYKLMFKSQWEGCWQQVQRFWLILEQKKCLSGIPNSRLKISSPIESNNDLICF